MKKIISAILTAAFIICAVQMPSFAAESWRDAFVTRIMKIMSSDPTYNNIALTDLDSNGKKAKSEALTVSGVELIIDETIRAVQKDPAVNSCGTAMRMPAMMYSIIILLL